MSEFVFATVIVTDQSAAQAVWPDYFNAGFSADGTAPATHWVTSGPYDAAELEAFVNQRPSWVQQIYFGNDVWSAMSRAQLTMVSTDMDGNPVTPVPAVVEQIQADRAAMPTVGEFLLSLSPDEFAAIQASEDASVAAMRDTLATQERIVVTSDKVLAATDALVKAGAISAESGLGVKVDAISGGAVKVGP